MLFMCFTNNCVNITYISIKMYLSVTFPVNPGMINSRGLCRSIPFPLSIQSTDIPKSPTFSLLDV